MILGGAVSAPKSYSVNRSENLHKKIKVFLLIIIGCFLVLPTSTPAGQDASWQQKIPLNTHWNLRAIIKRENTSDIIKNEIIIELQGDFWIKRLPHEPNFSKFFQDHKLPYGGDLIEWGIAAMEWLPGFIELGYSSIEGTATGTISWTELPHSFRLLHGTWFHEGLPETKYPISAVVTGACWLEGIQLRISPNKDIFSSQDFSRKEHYYILVDAGGRIDLDTEAKVSFATEYLPGVEDTPGSYPFFPSSTYSPGFLELDGQTKSFTQFNIPNVGRSDVEITITPDCPVSFSQFDISATRITPSWSPNNTLSAREIEILRASLRGESPPPDASRIGYTHTDIPFKKPTVEVEWQINPCQADSDRVCLSIDKIDLAQDLPISMYITNKYRPGTCPYNALVAHEMKHSDSFINATDAFLEAAKEALLGSSEIPSRARPILVSVNSVSQEQERIAGIIHDIVWNKYLRLLEEFNQQTNSIDTPEEYARVRAQCPELDWR